MKSRSLHLLLFLMLLFSAVFPLGNAQAQPAAQGASESHEGVFSIVWGNTGDHGQAVTLFFLHGDDGVTRQIFMDEELARPFGGVLALNRKRVTVRGAQETMRTPQGDRNGLRADSIDAPTVSPNPSAAPSALVSGSKPWVSIMCKFNDDPAEPKNLAYFQGMFSSSYPGFDHYWQEQSYGTVNVAGSTAVGWFTLPQPRFYYVYDMDGNGSPDLNHDRAADDCTKVADDAGFNFSNIQGINLMFNANLDGSAWGGSWCVILDGVNRCLSMTWEPPWGYENIAVISHEMGHGFGLPHSSGKNYLGVRTTYNNRWDVMSDIWTDCGNSTHATYGCLGQGIISYHKDLLGWIPSLRKFTAPGGVSTITLEQLTQPAPGNYLMAQIPIGSTGRFYTVEVRSNLVGYDIKLPGKAVIIHEVWPTGRTDPADVVDADGNGNTGDAGAMWTVGETFSDVANGISVRVDSQSGTSFVVTITTPGPPPTATAGIYDDKATVWAYTGTWTNVTVPSAYSGAYKTSSTVGASATVYFTGVQAKLYYTQNSTMGKLDVYIDNVKVTSQPINQYSLAAGYQKPG